MAPTRDVTELLLAWRAGDDTALARLTPLVYDEMKRLARHYMAGERPGHTLQATALVNEAYMRLVDSRQVKWNDRAHFLAVSAQLMQRVLVDYSRSCRSQKRGGGVPALALDEALEIGAGKDPDLAALDEALEAFSGGR